jgi:DedD protein
MPGGARRGGGDRVLESRHLVGLFLGVVLLCCVFFTLGYVMGKTQYGGLVHAAEALERNSAPARAPEKPVVSQPSATAAPPNSEWDFYSKNNNDALQPAAKPAAPGPTNSVAKAPSTSGKTVPTSAQLEAPRTLKGALVLQVAAVTRQGDALAMADLLQQKRFPSFVVAPTTDNYYRVQVGPYADQKSADAARSALDRAGFKAIIKR